MRPLFAHRWPLLAIGGSMVVLGLLLAWAMFLQSGATLGNEARLAQGPKTRVIGSILLVEYPRSFDGRVWDNVRYRFEWQLPQSQTTQSDPQPPPQVAHVQSMENTCFVPTGSTAVGEAVPIDVLNADANISCIEGGALHMHRSWLYAPFWLGYVVIPGMLILLTWLAGMSQLHRVLVHGDVSVATVRDLHLVRLVLPPMLSVAYEFRDHRAVLRRSRHWVRCNGALGQRLLEQQRRGNGRALTVPVLHDRRFPQWSRLLLAQDFLATKNQPTLTEQS